MRFNVKDFLFSYGMIFLGILIIFVSTIIAPVDHTIVFDTLPISDKRPQVGGDINTQILPVSKPASPQFNGSSEYTGTLSAQSAIVLDAKTRSILFEKNINDVRPLASITKLMTALVIMDLPMDWKKVSVITEEDWEEGSDHHVSVGEKYTVEDLWNVGLIGSSNVAINALVSSTGLTKEEFVNLMNNKAKSLHLYSARFDEPTGLSEKNLSNIQDVAKLLLDAVRFDKIYNTLQKAEYFVKPLGGKGKKVWSTNWLLTDWIPSDYKLGNIVGKTGYINSSGYNFAVKLSKNGKHDIVVVVLGAASNESRFTEARDLGDWVFANYVWPGEESQEGLEGV